MSPNEKTSNTPDDASPDGPAAWRPALWLHPPEPLIPAARGARPGHHADPNREVRATADLAL
jgi:hypothetical protein